MLLKINTNILTKNLLRSSFIRHKKALQLNSLLYAYLLTVYKMSVPFFNKKVMKKGSYKQRISVAMWVKKE